MRPRLACVLLCGLIVTSSPAADKVAVLKTGSQAGHYMVWNDRPILPVGDSVTQGWMECGTDFDQRAYVDALAARGLNLLMLWAFKGTNGKLQQEDGRIGYDAPELWPWAGSPDARTFDPRRFNPAYFDRLTELVSYAESKHLLVLITIHDGWTKSCFDAHPFNRALGNGPLAAREQYVELADYGHEMPAEFNAAWNWRQQNQHFQERYCAELIENLQPFSNVIYEMFNEGEWYDRVKRHQHEQHFLAFFRARCNNLLLSNSDHITGDDPHRDAQLDVITLHPKGWVGQSNKFAEGFHSSPPKPYLYSEPVPEFDGESPSLDDIRRSVWETTLAGAGWVNQNDPSFGWDARAAIAANASARDRAYDYAGHCARFFNQSDVRFWEMSPQGNLASTGICLARPGTEYVAYSPTDGIFTMDLTAAAGRELAVLWYQPRTGEFRSATAIKGGNFEHPFAPPFAGDAVLHLASPLAE
ncbi:MAG: putative collagen-binding domain-containing protein [Pirellulaceae bacterium]